MFHLLEAVLREASYEFGSILPSGCTSAFSQPKISELACQFFLIFCIKSDSHKVREVTKPNFWKNVLTGRDGSKSRQNGLKMRFLEFWQKSNPIICPFLREYESNYHGPTSLQKSHVWKKCGSWVRTPKQSEYLLNYNVSQTSFVFD